MKHPVQLLHQKDEWHEPVLYQIFFVPNVSKRANDNRRYWRDIQLKTNDTERYIIKLREPHGVNIIGVVEAANSSLVTQTPKKIGIRKSPDFSFIYLANPREISCFYNIKNGLVLPCFEG